MNKTERVEEYLKEYGSITSLEIMQLVYSMCPHSIIRNLREKHGFDAISDEWNTKINFFFDGRKQKKQAIRYKRYYWKKVI